MNNATNTLEHLTIHSTSDQVAHQEMWVAGGAFGALLDWVRSNELSLHHDPDSDDTITGYYVRDDDGRQVAAATLTSM